MAFSARIASTHNIMPMMKNMPVSEPNINKRCVSQSSTMMKIANNTTLKQRQNSATNAMANNEISRTQPSSKSVESSSRRVRVIASKVVAICLIEAIKPSSAVLDSSVKLSAFQSIGQLQVPQQLTNQWISMDFHVHTHQ